MFDSIIFLDLYFYVRIKMNEYSVSGTPKLQKPGKLRECLGGDYKDHKHLGELNEQQMRRMKHVSEFFKKGEQY